MYKLPIEKSKGPWKKGKKDKPKFWTDKYKEGQRIIYEDEEATVREVGTNTLTVQLDSDGTYQVAHKDDLRRM